VKIEDRRVVGLAGYIFGFGLWALGVGTDKRREDDSFIHDNLNKKQMISFLNDHRK
jgi:hypothetical protein